VFHLLYSKGCATAFTHNRSICSLYRQYCVSQFCYTTNWASTELQQSVNRASTECQQSVSRVSTERQQSVNRASTERQQSVNRASTELQQSVNRASIEYQKSINTASTECQQSVNDFGCCILYNPQAVLWQLPIMNVLAAVMRKRDGDMVTAPVWKWASTERQWFWVLHLV
jgi:gas vesicle protein